MSEVAITTLLDKVKVIHTLGPTGTNCERAALEWFRRRNISGRIVLYDTLEEAVEQMPHEATDALLGCVVYPDLHTLVFSNLCKLTMAECFIFPTFNMVLASRDGTMPRSVASHPAPQHLVPAECDLRLVSSNVLAAIACADGSVDGCITTLPGAAQRGLVVVRDYGPLNMGFTIHIPQPSNSPTIKRTDLGIPARDEANSHYTSGRRELVAEPAQ